MSEPTERPPEKDFRELAEEDRPGFLKEMLLYLKDSKKWWLTPILVVLILVGGLLVVGTAAPFIYTLF